MDGRLVVNPAGIHICLAKKFGVSHNYQIWERALESLKNGDVEMQHFPGKTREVGEVQNTHCRY